MELLYSLSALFSLIVIIQFFSLVHYAKKINQTIASNDPKYWQREYNKARFLYRDDRALFCLQELIWHSILESKSMKNYEAVKLKYMNELVGLGGKFPEYPF